jgi:hypothetical protein
MWAFQFWKNALPFGDEKLCPIRCPPHHTQEKNYYFVYVLALFVSPKRDSHMHTLSKC